ncbi:MAG: DNA translocase FtsK 4TM domain-containing protein, partial [Candidatus Binatia bacterium]
MHESVALLVGGVSAFLLVSLWSTPLGGAVGRLVAAPLRQTFGQLAFAIPLAGFAAAVSGLRGGRLGSARRLAAFVGLLATAAVLVESAELHAPRVLGGILGDFLATVLEENFGAAGAYCLVVPLFVLSLLATAST